MNARCTWYPALLLFPQLLLAPGLYAETIPLNRAPELVLDGKPVAIATTPSNAWLFLEDPGSPTRFTRQLYRGVGLPTGQWRWHAEGPGWITIDHGTVDVEGQDGPILRSRVVPGCIATLAASRAWQAVDSIEVLSQDWGLDYRVYVKERAAFVIPRGRFALAIYSRGVLVALRDDGACDGLSPLSVPPPAPPSHDSESTLLRLSVPEPLGARVSIAFRDLHGAGPARVTEPTLVIRASAHVLATFGRRDASPAELLVSAPDLRSLREVVPPQAGAARELTFALRPRATLGAAVDFRAARRHRTVSMDLLRCFDKPIDALLLERRLGRGECQTVATRKLEAGRNELTFDDLDNGQYALLARIDDETVSSTEWQLPLLVTDQDDVVSLAEPWRLRELHIFGQLLQAEQSVPGRLSVAGLAEDHRRALEFPTDADGYFHWYFIGRPFRDERKNFPMAEMLAERGGESLGAPLWCRVLACTADGACFPAASEAYFVGEGQFDISLPAAEPIRITIREADTGDPIEGALGLLSGRAMNLAFLDGRVEYFEAPGFFDVFTADSEGQIGIHLPVHPRLRLILTRRGYSSETLEFEAPVSQRDYLVNLRLSKPADSGTALMDSSGRPLAGAGLLAIGWKEGRPRALCALKSNERGFVTVPRDRCALDDASDLLVIHNRLGLTRVDPSDLARSKLEVPDLSGAPPVVRLVTADGEPASGRRAHLGIRDYLLGNDEEWAIRGLLGVPDLISDEKGEITFEFLSDDGDWFAEIEAAGAPDGDRTRVPLSRRGGERIIDVIVVP